jgi:hypothetical protein
MRACNSRRHHGVTECAWVHAAAIACVAVATACTGYPREEDGSVAATEQPLWTRPGVGYAPSGRSIDVCFSAEAWDNTREPEYTWTRPVPTGSDAYVRQTTRIRELLEREFENIPGVDLDFQGFADCEDQNWGTQPGWLRYRVRDGGSFNWVFRNCTPEEAAVNQCNGANGFSTSEENTITTSEGEYDWGLEYDSVVLHETLHALGFQHEADRNDEADTCIPINPDKFTPGTMSGPRFLTEYDPYTPLNSTYCQGVYPGALSQLDHLGLEIVYPATFQHTLSSDRGFKTRTGYVVRDDEDTLISDWTSRGATEGAFAAYPAGSVTPGPIFIWFEGQNVLWYGATLPVHLLGTNWSISASFQDFRGRQHTVVPTTVRVSNRAHAGMMMAAVRRST